MRDDDIPSLSQHPGITRQEWTNLFANLATANAKIDQLLEYRREDSRRMGRLEERQDRFETRMQAFDDRLSTTERVNSKLMGRKEIILLIAGSVIGGLISLVAGFDLKTILSYVAAHLPNRQ